MTPSTDTPRICSIFGPGDRLAIGNDGEGFEGGLGKSRRPCFDADQGFKPGSELGLGYELPGAGHAHQPVTARGRLVFGGQLLERHGQFRLLDLLEIADAFIAFGMFEGTGQTPRAIPAG